MTPSHAPSIVVVEDEAIVAEDLRRALAREGFRVLHVAATGEAALEAVSRLSPDVVLMDVNLGPGMSGVDAARLIEQRSQTPVVFLTGYDPPGLAERLGQTTPCEFVVKPFLEVELGARLRRVIERREAERQRVSAAVASSEMRLREFMDAAPDGFLLTDDAGRIVLTNSRLERLLGYERGALVGQAVESLIPRRFHSAHAERRQRYLSAPHVRRMTEHLIVPARRSDGSEVGVQITLSPFDTPEGPMVISVIRETASPDVSGPRPATASPAVWALFDQLGIGGVELAWSGAILSGNNAFWRMLGRAQAEATAHVATEWLAEDDWRALQSALSEQPQACLAKAWLTRADGSRTRVRIDASLEPAPARGSSLVLAALTRARR